MKRPGRNDNTAWRAARARAIANANGQCQLCHQPLVPTAPRGTDLATEVDHIKPLSEGGAPYDPTNLRAVHRACHIDHGRNGTRPPTPDTSREPCPECGRIYCGVPTGLNSRCW